MTFLNTHTVVPVTSPVRGWTTFSATTPLKAIVALAAPKWSPPIATKQPATAAPVSLNAVATPFAKEFFGCRATVA